MVSEGWKMNGGNGTEVVRCTCKSLVPSEVCHEMMKGTIMSNPRAICTGSLFIKLIGDQYH